MATLKTISSVAAMAIGSSLSFAAASQGDGACEHGRHRRRSGHSGRHDRGRIRKVDNDPRRVTIKHGAIKNLDMPGMTMVFLVKNPAMLDTVKPGDKVKFKAERVGGGTIGGDRDSGR